MILKIFINKKDTHFGEQNYYNNCILEKKSVTNNRYLS